jgi:hypothetical protein
LAFRPVIRHIKREAVSTAFFIFAVSLLLTVNRAHISGDDFDEPRRG